MGPTPIRLCVGRLGRSGESEPAIGAGLALSFASRVPGGCSTRRPARRCARPMPSIVGPYDPPFDPWNHQPTWLVPLAALNRRPTVLLAICACQHKRRWPVAELVERYGGRRMVQDLLVLALLEVRLGGLPAVRDRQVGAGKCRTFRRPRAVALHLEPRSRARQGGAARSTGGRYPVEGRTRPPASRFHTHGNAPFLPVAPVHHLGSIWASDKLPGDGRPRRPLAKRRPSCAPFFFPRRRSRPDRPSAFR